MIQKRNWSELSTGKRTMTVLAGLLQVTLLIVALWDIQRRSEDEIKGSKKMWRGVVFINWIGPIAYFVFGRER
jgi:hypothetical protein